MKLIITRAEWDKVMNYEQLRRDNPCKRCHANTGWCTGCAKEKEWRTKFSSININEEYYGGILEECVKAFWDNYEANLEEIKVHQKAIELQKEYDRLRAMIEVEGDME